ncbi:MAG: hypothetical protein H6502_01805 [Candidatus Woesearchaeota archaeon]|nr:MAG: hypothetical protein H6502_01805 [Candidatus Woesearchaeota archaeon]
MVERTELYWREKERGSSYGPTSRGFTYIKFSIPLILGITLIIVGKQQESGFLTGFGMIISIISALILLITAAMPHES